MGNSTKESNPNAMIDPLANIPPTGVKKIAKSASFPSVFHHLFRITQEQCMWLLSCQRER